MQVKKLLVIHPLIAPYRLDLFNRLSADFDTTIFLTKKKWENEQFNGLEKHFAFSPVCFQSLGVVKRILFLFSLLKQKQPDVVVVSECGIISFIVVFYNKLFLRNSRTVAFIDDSFEMISNNHYFSAKHKWAEKLLLPMLDNVVCVEPRCADFYQEKYGIGCCFPIIRDEKLLRAQLPLLRNLTDAYTKLYGLKDKTVFLFVGRLVALKNINSLITAFISAGMDNALLVIVGDGDEKENLSKLATGRNDILFTGRLEGLPLYAWYDAADVFILPSTHEAFGAVTNEALILGCRCLVSSYAGSCSLISDGVNGNVFNPYDLAELTSLLRKNNYKVNRTVEGYKACLMEKTFNDYYSDLVKSLILS